MGKGEIVETEFSYRTIHWSGNNAVIIDQTKLPQDESYLEITDYRIMIKAIKDLAIRGAPAIGIAAVFAAALAAEEYKSLESNEFHRKLNQALNEIASARPTAVNLSWGTERARKLVKEMPESDNDGVHAALHKLGQEILDEDIAMCRAIGKHGAELLPEECTVITHCNAGGLATGGFGTALGVILSAHQAGKKVRVYADETRPLLQGARLTAWELMKAGIDVTLICDNMAAYLMSRGEVDCCITGADRIAANGDVANKIGTYGLAVAAEKHGIPFYVAAPYSSLDPGIDSGAEIPIEEREPSEVVSYKGHRLAPEGVKVWNPAFDVTPGSMINAIITEKGIHKPEYNFR